VIFVTGLALLALVGVPVFALLGAAALALFLDMPDGSWSSVAVDVFGPKFAQNPALTAIPLFTFAGYVLVEAGTPRRMVRLARAWFGWMPGGLAVVCLLASAFFASFTGGSGITIVAVGGLLLPALVGAGYPTRFSLGLVTTGGSLGLLFPPSLPLILYGIVASLVMQKALVAGIVPGLFVMAALAIHSAFSGARSGVAGPPFRLREALASLSESKWELAIPVALSAGIVSGVLRVHEASAFTALYVMIVEVLVYRDLHLTRDLPRVIVQAITMLGAVPLRLASWMESVVHSKLVFLFLFNVLLLIVGMLMDIFTAIAVVVPLILPMAYAYGIDPYHLAVIFLLNLQIGYLTPPIGLHLSVSSLRFGRSVDEVYRTVVPFICVLIFTLLVVTYVPALTTWLPERIRAHHEARSLGGGYLPDAP
jgi:C4-dicarboxylate transporter, DctM subunit